MSSWMSNILSKEQYEGLVKERNELQQQLVKVENGSNLKGIVVKRLTEIRETLSNAHREQYKSRTNK